MPKMDKNDLLKKLWRELYLRNYSPRTVEAYMYSAKLYLKYLQKADLEKTDPEIIKDFLEMKRKEGNASATCNLHLNAIKFFHKEVLHNPVTENIHFAKRGARLPVALTKEEIKSVLEVIQNKKHLLLISLAYGAGLRVSEVINLKMGDLMFAQKLIRIRHAKGNRERLTIIPEAVLGELEE